MHQRGAGRDKEMKSNPEINALKHEIIKLRNAIVHYKAREEQLIDMLQRINEITEEKETRD